MFNAGETLTLAGKKGGRSLGDKTLDITATTTVRDLAGLFQDGLGIDTAVPDDLNAATPEAGAVWAGRGTIISPLKGVDSSVYEDVNELAVKEAEQVANATAVRFDGSDLLPAGTDLGAVLQAAIQDPSSTGSALEGFQSEVDAAWADSAGG